MAGFANTFSGGAGAPGFFNINQGSVPSSQAPAYSGPATTTTRADVAPPPSPFGTPLTATVPSKTVVGPAPAYRGYAADGTVFTDPNAQAQYEAAHAFKPIAYGGNTYKDAGSYSNAVLADAQKSHDDAVKQINTAHENGLISFEQQQKLIDQSRTSLKQQLDTTLGSQAGYINSISPDASQSQQGVLADQSNKEYQTGVGTINDQQTNLGTAKNDFATNYQNSLAGADKALVGAQDQVANANLAQGANQQAIINSGHQAADQFANSLAAYKTSAANASAPTVTQFDPGTTAAQMQGYVLDQAKQGVPIDTAIAAFSNSAPKGLDTNSPQYKGIASYVYNNLIDPKTHVPYQNGGYAQNLAAYSASKQ